MSDKVSTPIATPIEQAMERFRLAAEAESSWRTDALDDLRFSTGDQWSPQALTIRRGKPCLTMDQLQQSIRLVCNQYRQQPPSIDVNPVGDGADTDTAEILQGIVRHIEVQSDATIIYESVHEQVVRTGFGSCRLYSDYKYDDGDEQDIYIDWIRNQFSVYWEPGVDQSDATWCFIVTDLPLATYKEQYKNTKVADSNLQAIGNTPPEWITKDYVRVAEYFTVEVDNPTKKRPTRKVYCQKINAVEELEDKKRLPGTSIPIFTAFGDDIDVNGKRYVAGLVRNAKDPQKMYNYQCSAATEALALAPKAPWVVAEGQLSGQETVWNNPNALVLTYKQVDVSGKPAPPPQRMTVETPIQAITIMIRQAAMDLKAAMGIYDPSLGQRRGDESGTAIKQLQQQGNVATLNYSDNIGRMLKRLGRVMLQWIPEIYDTPRIQRIIKPDGSVDQVITQAGTDHDQAAQELVTEKIKKIYDIGTGKYDVVISVGPSYQTKRQEAVSTQLDFLKLLPPQLAANYIDLVTANMDWPQSKEFAARAKKMLPPQLQDGDDSDPEVKVNKLQSMLQQMSQQHEMLTAHVNDLTQQINTKQVEQQGKVAIVQAQEASAQAIAKMKIEAEVAMAEITTKAQSATERAQMYNDIWKELHGAAHDVALQKDQQSHDQNMAQQQAAQAAQSQQSDQAHQAQMAQQQQESQPVGAE